MRKILPLTLMLLTSCLSFAYQVKVIGLVAGPGGDGVAEARVLIYSGPNGDFTYENTVITNAYGIFEDVIDVPDKVQRGSLFVALVDCAATQVKRIIFDPRHVEHKVKLIACRDDHVECKVEIVARRLDNGQIALRARAKGRGEISFEWSTGETAEEIIVTELGEYCVEMKDTADCSDRDCIDLSDTDCAVEIKVSRADANAVLGSVILHARAKGHAPFSYLWSTGDTTKTIRVNEPGEYCVTITDAVGCESRNCVKVDPSDHCKTEIQVLSTDLANNGFVQLVARTIGRAPFSYRWSTGDTTQRIRVEIGGEYCVRVTDAAGCESGACIDLDRRKCAVKIQAKRSHPSSDTNSISLIARAKGRAPFRYKWSTGDTTNQIEVFEMGEYCVTVIDATGCETRDCIQLEIRDECATEIQIAHSTNDFSSPLVLVARTKGRAPFSYRWSTGDTTQTLIPGDLIEYCVEVVDATGCVSSDCIDLSRLEDSCAVEIKGSATGHLVAVTRGVPFVKYAWSTGETTKHIKVKEPGEYCVTITNAFGCEASDCIVVDGSRDTICRVKIIRNRTNDRRVVLIAKVEGLGDFNFLWSTGETTQSIIVDSTDEYCVVASTLNCKAEDCIKVQIGPNGLVINDALGLVAGQTSHKLEGKVSPNPFQGRVDIDVEIEEAGAVQIQIIRMDGKMVYHTKADWFRGSNRLSMNLDYLVPGMYFVRLNSGTSNKTIRIIKSE